MGRPVMEMVILSLVLMSLVALRPASAERRSAVTVIDIDMPMVFTMDFREGDRMSISASVHAVGPPISVFLIKGTASFNDWVLSEDVDIEDIKNGNASSGTNTTFLVVSNFSLMNTTDFDREMEIGDRDVYYLVIALHRYSGMPAAEVLLMTSTVDYDISWEFERKDIPLWLVPFAVLLFLAGTVMIAYYIWTRTVRSSPPPPEPRIGRGPATRGPRQAGKPPFG